LLLKPFINKWNIKSYIVKKLYIFLAFFVSSISMISQEATSSKEMMLEAESDFLYEEYNEALPLYLKLLKTDTSNYNLIYKVGVCYLNIPYEKEKSIQYLEKAIKNINPSSKPDNIKERQAPIDAQFYLGNAYRINNQLDKALNIYIQFKKQLDPDVFDEDLVNEQIKAIERAKKLVSKPVFFVATNLGEPINSKYSEFNAVVSGDENTLVYNVKLQFYDALYYSTKVNGLWNDPVNIIPDLGVDGDVYSTSLSFDGKELYIYRSDKYDGNIYVSHFTNNHWNPIIKLNDNINTKFWESHACVSSDGKTLYFTSNRKGGFGGLDIYKAIRSDIATDNWEDVQNLGPEINTPYNEETPFISQDGKMLYFSSYGHYNMGGYDIFYSSLMDNGKWSVPLNMGYPINTTDDDVFFAPVENGNFAYVCRFYPDNNYGKTDIYRIELFSEQHPRKFILKGLVSIPADLKNEKDLDLVAKLINKTSHDTLQLITIDPLKARFDTKLIAGNYRLVVQGKGLQQSTEEFTIKSDQPNNEITVSSVLKSLSKEPEQKKKIEPAQPVIGIINFDKSFFKVTDSNKLSISLNLEKGTNVYVNILSDTTIVKKDKFEVKRKNFHYEYVPFPGKNVLKFKAIGPGNNISTGEVIVYYEQTADTTTEKSTELSLVKRRENLLYAKNILDFLSESELKSQIEKLDIFNENISSLEELDELLKNKSQLSFYKTSDVDSLFKIYFEIQPKAANLLINSLAYMSSGKLKNDLDSLKTSKPEMSVDDIINYICNYDTGNNETTLKLLAITSRLADEGNVFYYFQSLKKLSTGKLQVLLDTLNLVNNHISSPEELLNYLLVKAPSAGYPATDVFKAFLMIPAFTASPSELLSGIIDVSEGKMKDFLKEVNLNEKQTITTSELGILLYNKALAANISARNLINLLIKVNNNFYFNQLVNDLNNFSSGKLKNLLTDIDIKNENINSSSELLNFILSHSNKKELRTELIKIFAQVASKNLLHADKFKPVIKKGFQFSIFTIGLFSIFFILLIAIIYYAFRKRDKDW